MNENYNQRLTISVNTENVDKKKLTSYHSLSYEEKYSYDFPYKAEFYSMILLNLVRVKIEYFKAKLMMKKL